MFNQLIIVIITNALFYVSSKTMRIRKENSKNTYNFPNE